MFFKVSAVFLVVTLFAGSAMALVDSCYYCDSAIVGAACTDPFDPNQMEFKKCNEMIGRPRTIRGSNQVPFSNSDALNKAIEAIKPNDNNNKNRNVNNEATAFNYTCVKAIVSTDEGKKEQIRTCSRTSNTIGDLCEYLMDSSSDLLTCSTCDSTNCNTGHNLKIFSFFIISITVLTKLIL